MGMELGGITDVLNSWLYHYFDVLSVLLRMLIASSRL